MKASDNMAEKSKHGATPFDSVLQPGEQILWQSSSKKPLMSVSVLRAAAGVVVFFALIVLGALLSETNGTKSFTEYVETAGLIVVILAMFGVPVLLIIGGIAVVRNWFKSSPVYAVTNYRLLVYSNKRFAQCGLNELPNMMKFESGGGRGTLNFGTVFPMFTDIPNVSEVYQLIQDLQRKSQKRAEMGY